MKILSGLMLPILSLLRACGILLLRRPAHAGPGEGAEGPRKSRAGAVNGSALIGKGRAGRRAGGSCSLHGSADDSLAGLTLASVAFGAAFHRRSRARNTAPGRALSSDSCGNGCRPPVAQTTRIHRISASVNRPLPPHSEIFQVTVITVQVDAALGFLRSFTARVQSPSLNQPFRSRGSPSRTRVADRCAAGASSGRRGPPPRSRQPFDASQVRGGRTGLRVGAGGGRLAHPSNQGPDERPSMPRAPRMCFFQFCST